MNRFRILPLAPEVASRIKQQMTDDYGNALTVTQAVSSRGVCRRCLHRFQAGERRILFKHRPFAGESVFAEAGPIYVHESDCRPAAEVLNTYPDEFRALPLLLRAYNSEDRQVIAQLIQEGDAEAVITNFFTNPEVEYLHLRDGEYGCYIARIEKATA